MQQQQQQQQQQEQQQQQQQEQPQQIVSRSHNADVFYGNEVQCKKSVLVTATILCFLAGFILIIVGFDGPTKRAERCLACIPVGFLFFILGFPLAGFTYTYFKKNPGVLTSRGNRYGEPAPSTLTFNQASLQSVNVTYPGTGRMQPSVPQPPYPTTQLQYPATDPYLARTHPYPTAPQLDPGGSQIYSTAPQSYPGSQQYPPSQSGPETAQSQKDLCPLDPPPPSYSEVVAGSGRLT